MIKKIFMCLILFSISCTKKNSEQKTIPSKKVENWINYNTKDSIPKQLKEVLIYINGDSKIANPKEDFEATDNIMDENLPTRQLRILARKNNEWRLIYKQGGFGTYYVYIGCKIENDSLSNLEIGKSLLHLENNDSISKFLKEEKIKLQSIKVKYK